MKLIMYLLLIYIVYRVIKAWMAPSVYSGKREYGGGAGQIDDIMVKDPVCGVYFPKKDGIYLNTDGGEMYFCSSECRDKYVNNSGSKK
jgi:uncharacterized protein